MPIPNSTNRVVALLPMKAHSSRVKNKNFRYLAHKPLYRWILDTLVSIKKIDKIIINTDARKILIDSEFPLSDKILIRDRPVELCGDDVSMNLVIADDIKSIPSDIYLMTHTTNPFLSVATIEKVIDAMTLHLKSASADSVFTVNKFQTRFYRSDCSPINHDPDNLIPTQNLEPWYEENSNLYAFTQSSFASTNARIGVRPSLVETNKIESVDIDTMEDWELASIIAKSY